MISIEQAHQNLKQVLLTGRILINGMPLTANELSGLLQGEQTLFEKAVQLDGAAALAKRQKAPKKNIIPISDEKKKE